MDQTADTIKQHIDEQREALADNVQELEDRARALTDWQEQYREHPGVILGAAFGGGLLLGALFGGSSDKNESQPYFYDMARAPRDDTNSSPGRDVGQSRAKSRLDDLQGALIGMAASKLEQVVREATPGFDQEIQRVRAEQSPEERSDPPSTAQV